MRYWRQIQARERQYKVALAIVRKTYGFNKPFDRITSQPDIRADQAAGDPGMHGKKPAAGYADHRYRGPQNWPQ